MKQKPLERLGDEITTLAAHIAAATARWLELVAEFDERGGWGPGGFRSCAHWVAFNCSMSAATAREHVRVAHRLRELPEVARAFARGELSYSKVRALTRVEDLADEGALLELAQNASAAQLERIVRGYRTVVSIEAGAERQFAERSVSWSWDEDGALVVRGRLPAEQGARLVKALEAARDELGPAPAEVEAAACAGAPWRDPADAARARNADALLALAEASIALGAGSCAADRYQVVVHVAAEALAGASAEAGAAPCETAAAQATAARCETAEGIPLPMEAARRLACDASLVRLLEADGRPLSLGRKTRTIAPALRRALHSRDGGCQFPGCGETRFVDAHHIHHWADGGRTDIGNLVLLCSHHHRLVHEGGYGVRRSRRGLAFSAPDGAPLAGRPPRRRGDCDHVLPPPPHKRASAEALRPRDGRPDYDHGWAVAGLVAMTRRRE